jgi:hypothetical protein
MLGNWEGAFSTNTSNYIISGSSLVAEKKFVQSLVLMICWDSYLNNYK